MSAACDATEVWEGLPKEDQRFFAAFRDGTLDPGSFHHRDHVRLAWLVLRTESLARALETFTAGLRRLAAAAGRPERYHETMTWALLLLINERLEGYGRARTWESFARDHPELLECWRPSGSAGI